jgi:hypothetical protein
MVRSFVYKLFILVFMALIGHEAVFAQQTLNSNVELKVWRGSAVELLKHIETQANVIFSYSNQICLPQRVVFQQKTASIKYFLDAIFETCHVEYRMVDNKIFITPIPLKNRRFTVNGFVRDSLSDEVLIGANIFDLQGNSGTATNDRGFFSLTLQGGDMALGCSYIGFDTRFWVANVYSDTTITIKLSPQPNLTEIPIIGMGRTTGIYSTRTGTIDIPVTQIQNIPSFMGEVDLIKSIQLLPGVQSGNEGFSGLYVRGGAADQNLILIDDVPVYNVEHLLGFFSIFNPDAINRVTLIKGGFPAQYGGRLSSVLDIRTFDGNADQHNGSASLGLLSSKFSINGPIIKQKTTYSLSFRRTYYDILAAPFQINSKEKSFYYFFDFNAKLVHRLSHRSSLTLSNYWGRDRLTSRYNFKQVAQVIVGSNNAPDNYQLNDEVATGWGNVIPSVKWTFVPGSRLFFNITGAYSNYQFFSQQSENFPLQENWSAFTRKYFSGIRDATIKGDIDYMPANGFRLKAGGAYTFHRFFPGIDVVQTRLGTNQRNDTTIGGKIIRGNEYHAYLQNEFSLSASIRLNAGIHFSAYQANNKTYHAFEPRVNFRYLVSPTISFKGAYSIMSQYLHVLSATNVSLPTDLWLPVTDAIKPMKAWQIDFGPEWEINDGFALSAEVYFKEIENILDYRENHSFFDFSQGWANKLTAGYGKSQGIEILLHRKNGDLSGWFGYTWSRSTSRFNELNNGLPFRANNDRRHDASLFLSYKFNNTVDANLTWTYGSGKPVTLANEKYMAPTLPTQLTGEINHHENYGEKNGYTMPAFHRMDVGFNFTKENRIGKRVWSVGIMNLYGRQNPFFLYFSNSEPDANGQIQRSLKQFSLFPIPFPYVRYTINF